uniref:Sfi1 spindle body domain-containing protein n=1 Tax=Globisporangium ultimum (strain ATCC 200006 / CBS 805.95 / DAOM BR144) TaxID=431595 RepID=K3X104_GLOUD
MKREAQHDEDLQANWKSALCVTSLYDSYIQLQQENDALKTEVRELKHANELLTVQQTQRKSPQKRKLRPEADENLDSNVVVGGIAGEDSDDDDNESAQRYEQSRKEIRLLRAEKERLELVHTQYRKDTESQIAEYKAMYDQLTEKYQQRYALDPNGAKRVELAVQTLQDTLEEVMQEKDELTIRYKKLQEVYNQLQQEHNRTMHTLRTELQELQAKRTQKAKQSVATVLQRWYTVQLAGAWKQWTMNVAVSRMKETEKQSTDLLQRHYKAQAKHQRNHLVAKAMMRFMQAPARRTFSEWKQVVESRRNIRIQIAQSRQTNKYRTLEQGFVRWKQDTRFRIARRLSVERLHRVMVAHKTKNCWRKWTKEVFTSQVISEFKQKLFLLNKVMSNMKTELANANAKLTAAELDNGRLVAKHDIERLEMKSIMEQKHSTANELTKRIGSFFSRKNDRQLMQQIVAQWKFLSDIKRKRGHHAQLARAKLQRLKIQRSVSTWYAKTQNRQRYMHIVGHFVKRMQQLAAVRCFNAWRDNVDRKKQREQTLRSVISYMTQKHLVAGFRAWVVFRAQRQKVRHSIDLMCSICHRLQLYSAFTTMKHQIAVVAATNEAKKKLELETQWEKRFEQAKQDIMRLRRCLLYWRQRAMKMKSCNKLALKTVKRWRNGILTQLFTEWQQYVHEQRRQREFISRWLRRYSVTSLQPAWAKWQKHILLKCKQEEITRLQAENDDRVAQLQKEIDGLRAVHRNLVAENQQMKLNIQQQLQDAHKKTEIEIRRYKKYIDAFMLVYSQKQRTERLLECFKLWEKWVSTRKCKRRLVFNFAKACQQRVMLGVFKKWNYLCKHRCRLNAGVGLFRAVLDQHCIRQCFYTWIDLFQSSRKVRDFQEKHEHVVTQRLCRAVLQEWRIEARKSYLVRKTAEQNETEARFDFDPGQNLFEMDKPLAASHFWRMAKSCYKDLLDCSTNDVCGSRNVSPGLCTPGKTTRLGNGSWYFCVSNDKKLILFGKSTLIYSLILAGVEKRLP